MALPPLRVKITAVTEGFDEGIARAKRGLGGMNDATRRVGKSLDNISQKATSIGSQMTKISGAATAAAGGLLLMTKRSAENANQIGKAARTAGIGAESFQEMQFAVGQMADVTDRQFGLAMQKLTRRTGEAVDGNKAYADALGQIGITQDALQSGTLTTEDIFARLNERMARFESNAQAAAVASRLLGEEEGPKIAAAMRANADALEEGRKKARETGQVLSGEFVRNSEKMVDQFDVLSGKVTHLQAQLAEKLIPVLTDTLIPAIENKVIPAVSKWIDKIGQVITWFQDLPEPVQQAAGIIAGAIGAGGPVLLALGAFTKALSLALAATGPIGLFIAAAGLAVAAWAKWGDDIKAAVGGAIDFVAGKFDWLMTKIQGIIDKAVAVKDAIRNALTIGGGQADVVGDTSGATADTASGGTAIRGRGGGFVDAGRKTVDGFATGAEAAMNEREGFFRNLFSRPEQIALEELQIESPSKVFQRIGNMIGQGLSNGIEGTAALTEAAVKTHTDSAKMTAGEAAQNIVGSMKQVFSDSKPLAAAQALINTFLGITEALKLPFPASLAAAAQVAAQGFSAVQAIKSASPGGGGAASGGAASGGQAAAAPAPAQVTLIGLEPNQLYTGSQISGLLDAIEDELGDRGRKLVTA